MIGDDNMLIIDEDTKMNSDDQKLIEKKITVLNSLKKQYIILSILFITWTIAKIGASNIVDVNCEIIDSSEHNNYYYCRNIQEYCYNIWEFKINVTYLNPISEIKSNTIITHIYAGRQRDQEFGNLYKIGNIEQCQFNKYNNDVISIGYTFNVPRIFEFLLVIDIISIFIHVCFYAYKLERK